MDTARELDTTVNRPAFATVKRQGLEVVRTPVNVNVKDEKDCFYFALVSIFHDSLALNCETCPWNLVIMGTQVIAKWDTNLFSKSKRIARSRDSCHHC